MWSDNETSVDLLGFDHLVKAITSIVRNQRLLPTTIGVFGDWGSGKTSLIQMAAAELAEDSATLVLSFNGWLFEGFEDAKCALMGAILDEIAKREPKTEKAKGLLAKLLDRVNWFRLIGTAGKYGVAYVLGGVEGAGLSASTDVAATAATIAKNLNIDEAKKFIHEKSGQEARKAVRDFRDEFEELLNDAEITTLVVVIDDMDRCTPDTIIETLEAIKLFLFVKRTAFVIGADERLVKYAVRKRFPELPGERVEVGRDYLEKLIQFPIRVPQLGPAEMETYINCLFADIAGLDGAQFERIRQKATTCSMASLHAVRFNHAVAAEILGKVPAVLADRLSLAQRITPVLTAQLNGNPRQCKRFLNTLLIRLQMADSQKISLDQRVLAKLMLLELFRPETFRSLATLQSQQQGVPKEIVILEQAVTPTHILEDVPGADDETAVRNGLQGRKRGKSAQTIAPPAEESVPPDRKLFIETWLADSAIRDWLTTEPCLSSVDLRPYFFFARDKLSVFGESAQRMSQVAQQLLVNLTGQSDSIRAAALERSQDLSPADATSVFETLVDRARSEEDSGANDAALLRVFDLVGVRHELFGQLISALSSMPENRIAPKYVPKVRQVGKLVGNDTLAVHLLEKWAAAVVNRPLAIAAKQSLKPKGR